MIPQILQTNNAASLPSIPEDKRKAVELYIQNEYCKHPQRKFKPCNLYTEHGMVKRSEVEQIYNHWVDAMFAKD